MAQSLKQIESFDLTNLNEELFDDDYVHDSFETWKFTGQTKNQGNIEYEAKIHNPFEKNINFDDNLQFSFPFQKNTYWFGVQRQGELKFHIDLGQTQVKGQDLNIYANCQTNRKFGDQVFKVGINCLTKQFETNSLLEVTKSGLSYSQRLQIMRKNFFCGVLGKLGQQLKLEQYDGMLGYQEENKLVYLQHKSTDSNALKVGDINLIGIIKQGDKTFGIDLNRNEEGNLGLTGATSVKVNDSLNLKGKINNNFDLAISSKYQVNEQLSFTSSAAFDFSKGSKVLDFTQVFQFPFGMQFEINI